MIHTRTYRHARTHTRRTDIMIEFALMTLTCHGEVDTDIVMEFALMILTCHGEVDTDIVMEFSLMTLTCHG